MVSLDGLREVLGCRDGETVYEAAERVVRERDAKVGVTVRAWIDEVLWDGRMRFVLQMDNGGVDAVWRAYDSGKFLRVSFTDENS